MTARVEGLDRVLRKLERVEDGRYLSRSMDKATKFLARKIAIYPPKTEANMPGRFSLRTRRPMGHYVRGRGWVTPGGRQTGSSETLGKSWTTRITNNGRRGEVGTNVSYARFVHDKLKQARFHNARGWKTTQQVADENAEDVLLIFQKALSGGLNE